MDHQKELKNFLSRKRKQLKREKLGLSVLDKRHQSNCPKRHEIASLLHISPEWYERIEQGRANISDDLYIRIVNLFQFTEEEQTYLSYLIGKMPSMSSQAFSFMTAEELDALYLLVQKIPYPAALNDYCWNILHWNDGFVQVFGDIGSLLPEENRNSLSFLFHDSFRERIVNWDVTAKQMLALFRADYIRRSIQPEMKEKFESIINDLYNKNEEFAKWMEELPFCLKSNIEITVKDGSMGCMSYKQASFILHDNQNIYLTVYMPILNSKQGKTQIG
ncbi:hypothetical protein GTO91_09780 [Heliobacterium undosum]|uniref:MmyB-like transcription regulator ligand binding domain-containing protein n=1 Tax=Heliomicrobium undosum TaxID=121734 RepID=A0A845L1A3_9FIRM|nr:helix-turn-helix domain-containing protein [Heliomicrobium undosum]MZP29993.1 hypothetical protein [Heliomicrobium undosum]